MRSRPRIQTRNSSRASSEGFVSCQEDPAHQYRLYSSEVTGGFGGHCCWRNGRLLPRRSQSLRLIGVSPLVIHQSRPADGNPLAAGRGCGSLLCLLCAPFSREKKKNRKRQDSYIPFAAERMRLCDADVVKTGRWRK